MEKVNNKNGIEFYYELTDEKVNILDTTGKFFEDLYLDWDESDANDIIKILEETTLEEMADFFCSYTLYNDLDKLCKEENLTLEECGKDNECLNTWKVNEKTFYTFC